MKNIFKYLVALSLILLIPASADQTKEEEIKEMMIKKSDIFFAILNDKCNDPETRKKKVLDTITPIFDFKLMSRLALDKNTWNALSDEQKSSFSDIFISRVQRSYLNKLDVFSDVEITVEESIRVKSNRIEVTALMKTKADTKKLVYKFYLTKEEEWLIYDISVVGVSFLQSYRSQYASYLKEHSFEELLEKLKNSEEDSEEEKKEV